MKTKQQLLEQFNQLEEQKDTLLKLIEKLSADQLQAKANEKEWSLAQVFQHLLEVETGSLEVIAKKLKEPQKHKKSALKNWYRVTLLKVALALPFKYKAPKIVSKPKNTGDYTSITDDWNEVRSTIHEMIETNSLQDLDKEVFRHPYGGWMNIYKWLAFVENHHSHHVKQIENLCN